MSSRVGFWMSIHVIIFDWIEFRAIFVIISRDLKENVKFKNLRPRRPPERLTLFSRAGISLGLKNEKRQLKIQNELQLKILPFVLSWIRLVRLRQLAESNHRCVHHGPERSRTCHFTLD